MAESLLISRNREQIAHYLPYFRRSAAFIESRRDPACNFYLAGTAGNLLAPSYTGYKIDNDTFGVAYLSGLSITWIGALDRLIELEKLAGKEEYVRLYTEQRRLAQDGLKHLLTEEGYFIHIIMKDGSCQTVETEADPVSLRHDETVTDDVVDGLAVSPEKLRLFRQKMSEAGLGDSYEARHASLILDYLKVIAERKRLLAAGILQPLPEDSQEAADRSYVDAVLRLSNGFCKVMSDLSEKKDPFHKQVWMLWSDVQSSP